MIAESVQTPTAKAKLYNLSLKKTYKNPMTTLSNKQQTIAAPLLLKVTTCLYRSPNKRATGLSILMAVDIKANDMPKTETQTTSYVGYVLKPFHIYRYYGKIWLAVARKQVQRKDQLLPGIETTILLVDEEKSLCGERLGLDHCLGTQRWTEICSKQEKPWPCPLIMCRFGKSAKYIPLL